MDTMLLCKFDLSRSCNLFTLAATGLQSQNVPWLGAQALRNSVFSRVNPKNSLMVKIRLFRVDALV